MESVMQGSRFKALWDFISLSSGEIIGKIAGLLAFAYLARVLGPTPYGSVEVALALLGFFTLFVQFGFGPIGAREISQDPATIDHYAAVIPGTRLLLVMVCIPAMVAVAFFSGKSPDTRQLIYLTAFALLPVVWNQSWLFQGLEKMQVVSFNQVLKMVVYAACVFLLIKSADDLLWVGGIELFSACLAAIYFLFLQRRERIPLSLTVDLSVARTLLVRSFAVGSSNLVWALNQYLPTLIVAALIGGPATAMLGAAHRIVNAIITFSMVYHFNLFPVLSRRLSISTASFHEIVYPSFRVTAWGGTAIAVSLSLLAGYISKWVFGGEFGGAGLPMAILAWSLPLTLLNGHARWALIARDEQRYVLFAQASGTATTVLGCLLLIPRFGPAGGALAMVACSAMVWLVAHCCAVRKVAAIPSLDLVWRPFLLAAAVLSGVYTLTDGDLLTVISAIVGFVLLAPLLDMSLLRDIHKLSAIKQID